MIPLVPALVLAFLSFSASAFVILRIILPILPPSPLSRRVSPSEFGLPAFRSLAPADKGHLWLAGFDILALIVFVWHVISEATSGPTGVALASDPLSSARLWLLMTTRQGCLFVIAALTLLHVRMGRSLSLGKSHWMVWAPVVVLTVTSTALAGVMSGAGVESLFLGLTAYSGTSALLTAAIFITLFFTLYAIKRNLAALNQDWSPIREIEQGRPSFATEDIDAIKGGASWVTSNPGSRPNSVSQWSFSTHQTAVASVRSYGRTQKARSSSMPGKCFWPRAANGDKLVPPVPALPSSYGASTLADSDPDPFRRDLPLTPNYPRNRLDSQCSWITSTNGSHTTRPAWSFAPSHDSASLRSPSIMEYQTVASRPTTPALATAKVLGGYGFDPHGASQGSLDSLAAPEGTEVNISLRHIIGWLVSVWLPLALSLPYLVTLATRGTPSTAIYVLYVLSVTIPSPLLAFNIVFKSPLPVPTGLFDRVEREPAPIPKRLSIAPSELLPPQFHWSHEYRRSMSSSPTVVEGRRSGDVWISNGDAVEGKTKLSRAMSMLSPNPKLSVMPPDDLETESHPDTPARLLGDSLKTVHITTTHSRSQSDTSAEFGQLRSSKRKSRASSHSVSVSDESHATKIMYAQKHYSALAQTIAVSPGNISEKQDDDAVLNASGAVVHNSAGHLRTRSITTSFSGPLTPSGSSIGDISLPPPFPLPPTPPSVRAARQVRSHKKSSSPAYSFNAVDSVDEIDDLTAGVLPLLVPGLEVGDDVKIRHSRPSPPGTWSKHKGRKAMEQAQDFGEDFSSPDVHSTPARGRRAVRSPKELHKKNHFSLPSLSLGKDGLQSLTTWGADIRGAIENKVGHYMAVPGNVDLGYRNSTFGTEATPTNVLRLETALTSSTRAMGLRPDVPISARSSSVVPSPAASTETLFEDFEAELQQNHRAHSTPPSTTGKPFRQAVLLMPKSGKHSSIVYIRSENVTATTTTVVSESTEAAPQSSRDSMTQWSARTVKPLIPKAGLKKLKVKGSGDRDSTGEQGLRQLTLLQDKDTNSIKSTSSRESRDSNDGKDSKRGSIRPLTLGKKQKARNMTVSATEEQDGSALNMQEEDAGSLRGVKPLKLARSETSKQRGILRKTEALPRLVIRPPSAGDDDMPHAYPYNAY